MIKAVEIGANIDEVCPGAARNCIVSGSSDDFVSSITAVQTVIAGAPLKQIITATAGDCVVATQTENRIVADSTVENVREIGAN